jgi:hypothetical protein
LASNFDDVIWPRCVVEETRCLEAQIPYSNQAADLKDLPMGRLIVHQGGMLTEEVDHAA